MQVQSDKALLPARHALPTRLAIISAFEAKVQDPELKAEASKQIDLCFQLLAFTSSHGVGDAENLVVSMERLAMRLFSQLFIERRAAMKGNVKGLSALIMEEVKQDLKAAGFALPDGHTLGQVSAVRFG